jgi:protein-tyrosine phosphatase
LYLPIDDSPQQELSQFFDVSFQFIDKNIERTNVLVHCYSGVSRSAAIIAAYLIKKYSFTLKESIILLRNNKKRV